MFPLTENFQSPDTMSTAPAAVAASVAANAAASLNARLLLFCIVPPHANVFADDYYKCRVGISQFTGSAERLSKPRAIHLGNASFAGSHAASSRLLCAVNPSEYRERAVLRATLSGHNTRCPPRPRSRSADSPSVGAASRFCDTCDAAGDTLPAHHARALSHENRPQ